MKNIGDMRMPPEDKRIISLRDARRQGRLKDFIAQEEKRGIGPTNRNEFDRAVAELAKQRQSEDQTSRSSSRDGSSEK